MSFPANRSRRCQGANRSFGACGILHPLGREACKLNELLRRPRCFASRAAAAAVFIKPLSSATLPDFCGSFVAIVYGSAGMSMQTLP